MVCAFSPDPLVALRSKSLGSTTSKTKRPRHMKPLLFLDHMHRLSCKKNVRVVRNLFPSRTSMIPGARISSPIQLLKNQKLWSQTFFLHDIHPLEEFSFLWNFVKTVCLRGSWRQRCKVPFQITVLGSQSQQNVFSELKQGGIWTGLCL